MYDSQTALIANYINPIIGDMEVQDITTRVVDKYIQTLQKTPSVSRKNRKARTEFVTNSTIEKIIKLLRCAFKQAVRWELIEKNPFDNVVLPKTEYKKRDIWDAETIRLALDQCTDSKLYIAMNLAFACSLRMGEILGLTWKNVHIEDENIATDNAYIYIEAELARASKQAIETLGEKDIYHIFTPLMPNTSTRIILKKPKTDSSIRKVWLPKTVAYILREWKTSQEELKSFLGDEYQDFDLVVALPNGRPCENRIIEKEFSLLKQKAGLPNVVFHSLRHSSTTYKLKLNHGDLKVTQGDTGHAEIDMITKVYAHILDEDRKINAQKFESAFYANPDLRKVTPPQEQPQAQTDTAGNTVEVPQLAETIEASSVDSNRIVSLAVNANTGNSYLKDAKVRAALSQALDRTAAAQAAGGDAVAKPALSLSTQAGDILSAQPDTQAALEAVEAVEAKDEDKSIEIVYLDNEQTQAALETVKSAWESLGFSVTLTAQDPQTFTLSRNSLQYSDVLCSVWDADVQDQQLYLQPYLSSNMQSGCGYSNPEFDQLMLDAIQGEQAQRQSALTDAEKLLLSDAYVMPLYRQMVTITTDTAKVSGWSVSADGTLWFGSAAPAEK